MAKQKTPQELYKARKEQEEAEKSVYLPPGLVNHGNTCFMNSVLQGLIATRYLKSLFEFSPLPQSVQQSAPAPIASRRSPLLTNGGGIGGKYEQDWEAGMPIGDVFVTVMKKSWALQQNRRRENMSPRDLLTALGQKYDQYLDFRQQDAHEFLRQILDAMRMEELDIIKKRQPPPPKNKRLHRRSTIRPLSTVPISPSPLAAVMNHSLTRPTYYPDSEDKLASLADMLFGGKLTSLLVCQKCKHISHTYEDFNDLSLSIKPEDYARERKRDRLKTLAKKFKNLHGPALTVGVGPSGNVETQRSSSVPPSPRKSVDAHFMHEPPLEEPRRRSLDFVEVDQVEKKAEGNADGNIETSVSVATEDEKADGETTELESKGERVEFLEPLKIDKRDRKAKDDDGWARLGRRISVTVGFGKDKGSRRQSRSADKGRGRRSFETPRGSEDSSVPAATISSPQPSPDKEPATIEDRLEPNRQQIDLPRATSLSPALRAPTSPAMSPPLSSSNRFGLMPSRPASPSAPITRSKSPKPPKATAEEAAYLRQILADITPSSSSPFGLFKPPSHQNGGNITTTNLLMKMGQLPGIEECLRMFTAVEVLDGENMVGCRRCWKIANGVYKPRTRPPEGCGDSDSDESEKSDDPIGPGVAHPESGEEHPSPPSSSSPSPSATSSIASLDVQSDFTYETPQSSLPSDIVLPPPQSFLKAAPPSLPLTDTSSSPEHPAIYGGMPIPLISTTAPESPLSPPSTARPLPSRNPSFMDHSGLAAALAEPLPIKDSLRAPKVTRHKRMPVDTDSLADSAEDSSDETIESDTSMSTSMLSDSSSIASPAASPVVSPSMSLEQLPLPIINSPTLNPPAVPSKANKTPRSNRIIMRPAYKRYLIGSPPPILVIHLKRFQQISKSPMISFSSGFKKLEDYVAFPEHLDITPFLAPRKEDFGLGGKAKLKSDSKKNKARCIYRLYAVVVHIGNMLGGHYVAYTALPTAITKGDTTSTDSLSSSTPTSTSDPSNISGPSELDKDKDPSRKWAYISDTIVRLATLEEVLKAKAYICMYERV